MWCNIGCERKVYFGEKYGCKVWIKPVEIMMNKNDCNNTIETDVAKMSAREITTPEVVNTFFKMNLGKADRLYI